MVGDEKERKSYFLETILASMVGTAAGCMIAYYTSSRQNLRVDRYIDSAIKFLDGVKKKTKPSGYDPE